MILSMKHRRRFCVVVLVGALISLGILAVLNGAYGLKQATKNALEEDSIVLQAFELRMEGKVDAAQQMLTEAIGRDSTIAAAQFELARVRVYMFEFEKAQECLEKAIESAPRNARYQFWAGKAAIYRAIDLAHHQGEEGAAEAQMRTAYGALEAAVGLNPDYHDARLLLIELYLKDGSPESIARAEDHTGMLGGLEETYGAAARAIMSPDKALEIWRETVAENPNDAHAHERIAKAYQDQGKTAKAVEHVDTVLALDPSRSVILLHLARYYAVAEEDLDAADEVVLRYLDSEPEPPLPLRAYATFMRAAIHKRRGDMQSADNLLDEAKTLDPYVWTTAMPPPTELFATP